MSCQAGPGIEPGPSALPIELIALMQNAIRGSVEGSEL